MYKKFANNDSTRNVLIKAGGPRVIPYVQSLGFEPGQFQCWFFHIVSLLIKQIRENFVRLQGPTDIMIPP